MSTSAVANQRWRWLQFDHWLTLAQRSSTSALTDSKQSVVLNERPSTAARPRRCKVRVSSRLSDRLPPGRMAPVVQLAVESLEGTVGLGVRRSVKGPLESPAPVRLLALGQVAHKVLALVPAATVSQRPLEEYLPVSLYDAKEAFHLHLGVTSNSADLSRLTMSTFPWRGRDVLRFPDRPWDTVRFGSSLSLAG